jgi:hypothetical protein
LTGVNSLQPKPTRKLATFALLAAVGLGLGACDRQDPADEAIQAASIKLQAISGGSAAPGVTQKIRKDTYQAVLTEVKDYTSSGTPAQQAAAQLLAARAQAGMGEIAAQDAAELERSFLGTLGVARARLDQWLSQNSVAAALKVYDPAPDLAALDKQIAERGREAEALRAELEGVRAKVDGLTARAKAASEGARAKRAEEAQIRSRGDGASQTQRLSLLEQSAAVRREADALDRQAGELQAEAAKLQPVATELERQVARLGTQQDLLRTAKRDASALAGRKSVASDAAREEAMSAAKAIDEVLKDLADQRQAISGPTGDAVRQYGLAAKTAKAAVPGSVERGKASAQMSSAAYSQALGDVRAGQARSLGAYIGLLQLMVDATPALPSRASIASTLEAAKAEFDQARNEAREAYGAALEGFSAGAGRSEEEKKLADNLKARLERLADVKPEAPATEAAPAGEGSPEGQPAAGSGEGGAAMGDAAQAQIRAAMDAMRADFASGDAALAIKHMHFTNPASKPVIESMIAESGVATDFDKACREKFGKGLQELIDASQLDAIRNNPMAKQMGAGLSQAGAGAILGDVNALLGPEASIRVISAGEAEITAPGVAEGLTLVSSADTGNAWQIKIDIPSDQLGMLQMGSAMLKPVSGVLKTVAADIRAGKYATGDEMLLDLNAKIMGAMMGAGSPPGGRPGSGGGDGGGGGGGGGGDGAPGTP